MTNAMKKAEVSVVVTLDFLRLPLISVVGVAFHGEAVQPMPILGAALMLTGNLMNVYKPNSRASFGTLGAVLQCVPRGQKKGPSLALFVKQLTCRLAAMA